MKLAINVFLSLATLALCGWLVWPNEHVRGQLVQIAHGLEASTFGPHLAATIVLIAATNFARAWRWQHLLRPIGVHLAPGKLLAIQAVSFMAILALPARLGEFARPALLRKRGHVSAAAVLGTVAVERIVDGLMVSLLVFFCCWPLRGPSAQPWMMPMAYTSLAIFLSAMTFLGFALRWPARTCRLAVTLSGLSLVSPRAAAAVERKLGELIGGFRALKDRRELALFVLWTAIYWVCNALSMWVLARGLGLDLPVIGAFATMGVLAVGITLPNSPGLVGQFHYFTTLGLSLYLPKAVTETTGLAYAIALHGLQVAWYLGWGAVGMLSSHISFAEVLRPQDPEPAAADPAKQAAKRDVA